MMNRLLDGLEKHRILIGSMLAVALLGIGGLLVWIDWHPPATKVTTTTKVVEGRASTSPQAPVLASEAAAHSSESPRSSIVNINTATEQQLDTLPGIGKTYALRIIEYRNQHGQFTTAHDIVKVRGIGEATYGKLKDLITTKE